MAAYNRQNQSPFFKTFAPRRGNVGQMWQSIQNHQREQMQAQARVPWFGAGNSRDTRGMLGQPLPPQPWQQASSQANIANEA